MKIQSSKFKVQNYNLKFKIFPFQGIFDIVKILRFAFCIFILRFAFCILHLNEAYAQGLSLSIWPPLLEVTIQPGKSITQVYKLRNTGETDLVLTSKILPFKPEGEEGDITFPKVTPGVESYLNTGIKGWFSFQNANLALGEKFLLPASREQEVVLKIKVPQGVPEDDYYFTLLFETIPGVFLPSGSGGQVEAKIGSNILLTVSQSGKPKKQAEIEEFAIRNSQFAIRNYIIIDSFTQPKFTVRLKNTGNAFFKPFGSITTTGWFNQRWVLNLLPENVLVNSIRRIQCQKSVPPANKESTPDRESFQILPSSCQLEAKFFLGKYISHLEFGLDEAGGKYQSQIVFWALPLRLGAGILIALILLLFIASKFPTLRK